MTKPNELRAKMSRLGASGKGRAKVRGDSAYYSRLACSRWKRVRNKGKNRGKAKIKVGK